MVLKSPDIPSVLVETGFISHPNTEQQLREQKHQRLLAQAILSGVKEYLIKYPAPHSRPPAITAANQTHRVAPNETLSDIASKYGIPLNALKQHNRLNNDKVSAGQVLKIPFNS